MNYATHDLNDTIVALATPAGVGAIGVIRLSGKEAIRICNKVFKGKNLEAQGSHTIHFGTIRNAEDQVIDEVLVSLFVGPTSYTGENVVEVSCHGSNYIIQQLIQLFTQQGARMAQPGEFTLRAFLNGRMDLSQAEAVADLIASSSEAAHTLAIQQMRGGFSDEIQKLRQQLLDFASLIELELDFSEEDVEFADRSALKKLVKTIQAYLHDLLQSFDLGNAIKNGINTVIAGRPNAGKSTLLNALLNEERAIVSDIAGTTRDTIEEVLNINGIQFRIIDTAGIREAHDQIEAIGVAKTMEKISQSALLIYVFDVAQMEPEEVRQDLARLMKPGIHLLVIANKMDLNPYTKFEDYFGEVDSWEVESRKSGSGEVKQPGVTSSGLTTYNLQHLTPTQWVPISALEKMNIGYLKEKLYESVITEKVKLDSTVVSNVRHYEALRKASESLDDVLQAMDSGITSDFVAMDIRRALAYLGEITGEISTDDLLGNIFGKFCIGK
ncbi:MAG: tRNA uridine-5-carboxymethylaminomethyl(34) synthesis GTPase MnmE [Saprospiraceae bacterium]